MADTNFHTPDDTLSYIAPIGQFVPYTFLRCRTPSPILPNHLHPVADLCHAVGPFVLVRFLSGCIGQKFTLFSSCMAVHRIASHLHHSSLTSPHQRTNTVLFAFLLPVPVSFRRRCRLNHPQILFIRPSR